MRREVRYTLQSGRSKGSVSMVDPLPGILVLGFSLEGGWLGLLGLEEQRGGWQVKAWPCENSSPPRPSQFAQAVE